MKLFGLTGGIGMGKSTSGSLLSERSIPCVDTDLLARNLVEPGCAALDEVIKLFGPSIVSSDGQLRRDELARKVFGNPAALRSLESILHPRIRELWKAEANKWRDEGCAIGVVTIPLLFETDAQSEFDAVICLACSEQTQQERLRERGWSDEQIKLRCASQWPVDRKMAAANYVIWTDTTLEIHGAQLDRILFS